MRLWWFENLVAVVASAIVYSHYHSIVHNPSLYLASQSLPLLLPQDAVERGWLLQRPSCVSGGLKLVAVVATAVVYSHCQSNIHNPKTQPASQPLLLLPLLLL